MGNTSITKDPYIRVIELEEELSQLRKLSLMLLDKNNWYHRLFNAFPIGVCLIDDQFRLIDANQAFVNLLGFDSFNKIEHKHLSEFLPQQKWLKKYERIMKDLLRSGSGQFDNLQLKKTGKKPAPVTLHARLLSDQNETNPRIAAFVENSVTNFSGAALTKSPKTIEKDVLTSLEDEITELRTSLNKALKEKNQTEDSVIMNVKEIISPYVDKLSNSKLDKNQTNYLNRIKTHLEEIISPFYKRLSARYSELTPTEIRIAGLVKEGNSTKDIAELLRLTAGTVEFHRNNLRKKFGIRNQSIGLRSYLMSLD